MADIAPLNGKDLTYKSYLTNKRKVAGRYVEEEIHPEELEGEEGLDTLLSGIDSYEVDEGYEKLCTDNPEFARQSMHDFLDNAVSSEDLGTEFNNPTRMASVKHAGLLMDRNTNETVTFRKLRASKSVEILDENGGVIETFSNRQFDELLDSGDYDVL